MIKTLLKLIPQGLAWLLPVGYMRALFDALAMELDRVATFLRAVATEANPATAISCLEEWYEQYGIIWDGTGSIGSQQEVALSRFISLGDQDIVYLQRMLDEAGLDAITISETPTTTYPENLNVLLSGEVPSVSEYDRVVGLVTRLFPAHLTPDYTGIDVDTNIWGEARHGLNVYAGI